MTSVMAHTPAPCRGLAFGRASLLALTAPLLLALPLATALPAEAASALLETVKQNPALAKNLCDQFKQRNAAGQSAVSKESISQVAASQGLSSVDAEVLTTYVIGLYCPDVR
jgi:hypothetical protein